MSDPLAAARWIEAHLDLGEVSAKWVERFGLAARPGAFFELTPPELIALFTAPKADERDELDQVGELRRHSHTVLAPKGRSPTAPDWLMKEIPRVRG